MEFEKLIKKLKKNWFLITIILAVLIVSSVVNDGYDNNKNFLSVGYSGVAHAEESVAIERSIVPGYYSDGGFAPDVDERVVEKSSYLSLEVKRGNYQEVEKDFKVMVKATEAILMDENVNQYDNTYQGHYTVKVRNDKYEFFIEQAKEFGEVLSFNDNARDVTGNVVSLEERIVDEKKVLADLEKELSKTSDSSDRIKLQEQIRNQERLIINLEKSLENQEDRVEYSTVSVNLQEAPSKYKGLGVVGFSDLIKKLVWSFNSMLRWIFGVLPYALLGLLVWLAVRFFKK